jgi:hypothetical protein
MIPDKCTYAMTASHQSIIFQYPQGFPNDRSRNSKHFAQLGFGGELTSRPKSSANNRLT